MSLIYTVRFGDDLGTELRPHCYKTGYRASKSKYGPHVYVRNASYREAIPFLRAAMPFLPNFFALKKYLGICLLETGETADGIDQLSSYVKLRLRMPKGTTT
jgi:hypothetical protein